MDIWQGLAVFSTLLFEKNSFEGSPEVFVKDSVNNRVQRWIRVAQPKGKSETPGPDTAGWLGGQFADGADGADGVQEEEGEPAGDETAHD